jgi:hypothetical protein
VYSYVAYGLGIRSALPLPELIAGEVAPDVNVRIGTVPRMSVPVDTDGGCFWTAAQEVGRFLDGIGTFLVRGGREIVVDPAPGVEERVLRLYILGTAFALLLHQRGQFVLHASAIESAGGAVVFAGGSGWGKSTLAAALHTRGCGLLTDDVTAIALDPECPTVLPGFPQLKLWPESVTLLGEAPEKLPRLHPHFEKRAHRVARGSSQQPLPLRRIYILAEGETPTIESLQPHNALLELVCHWYGSRFGDRLLQTVDAAALHFRQCATIANRVPVHRLRRPHPVKAILDLASLVEDDLAHDLLEQGASVRWSA